MDDPTIRSIAVEIFSQLCEVRPSAVREYVLQMSKQDDVCIFYYFVNSVAF